MRPTSCKLLVSSIVFLLFVFNGALAADLNNESAIIFASGKNLEKITSHNKTKRDVGKQISAMRSYTEKLIKDFKVSLSQKYAINNFIVYGTQSTRNLNAGQRFGLLAKYKSLHKSLPLTQNHWKNLLKLNATPAGQAEAADINCSRYGEKLKTCSAYKCYYRDPIFGATTTREIKGVINNKCATNEAGGDILTSCNLDASTQQQLSAFYTEISKAEKLKQNVAYDSSYKDGISISTYTINGIAKNNPLAAAFDARQCEVSVK